MRESSLDYLLSLTLFHSLILTLILTIVPREERVSRQSREKLRIRREIITFSRVPAPNFDLKFLHSFYPKIYIHIYGRCIRDVNVLTAYIIVDSGRRLITNEPD